MTPEQARTRLSSARLYAILDAGYTTPGEWPAMLQKLIDGGIDIVQIRAKQLDDDTILRHTLPLLPLAQDAGIPLIINDHPHLVAPTGAHGCHVGQDDIPVTEVRRICGPDAIVGKSTHSLPQALAAQEEAPDYIGVGPIFPTGTKPDYTPVTPGLIPQVAERVSLPQFCIGGITLEKLPEVCNVGASRVVIVSGLLLAADPTAYAREVCRVLRQYPLP